MEIVNASFAIDAEYSIEGLTAVLTGVEKILSFTGDLEEGQRAELRGTERSSLIRASLHQVYSADFIGDILRLRFDGDWCYDIYFNNTPGARLQDAILKTLAAELVVNLSIKKQGEWEFSQSMQLILG